MSKRKKLGTKTRGKVKVLAVLGLLLIVSLLLVSAVTDYLTPQKSEKNTLEIYAAEFSGPDPAQFFLQANSGNGHERPLFPLSVIPRGVASAQELRSALAHDPVATAHYAGFSIARSQIVNVEKARAVYVSYRLGNQIYWTRNRMMLRRGETLIFDGRNSARTRCGNRISDKAMLPVSAHEPPMKMLEEPAALTEPRFDENAMDFSPLSLAANHEPPPPESSTGSGLPGSPFVPVLCCGGSSVPPSVPPVKPPATTPEPKTWVLLTVGIIFLCLLRKK